MMRKKIKRSSVEKEEKSTCKQYKSKSECKAYAAAAVAAGEKVTKEQKAINRESKYFMYKHKTIA